MKDYNLEMSPIIESERDGDMWHIQISLSTERYTHRSTRDVFSFTKNYSYGNIYSPSCPSNGMRPSVGHKIAYLSHFSL